MRRRFRCLLGIWEATVLVGALLFAISGAAQTTQEMDSRRADSLKVFLQKFLGEPYPRFEKEAATRFTSALVDLKDDGTKEVIVYLSGRGWCGSGGCVMLTLAPDGGSYRVVTKTTVTRLPIRVLTTKSNGWHDITVIARINGIELLYEAVLVFDGKTYPSNPTVLPAHRLSGQVQGRVVITATTKDHGVY